MALSAGEPLPLSVSRIRSPFASISVKALSPAPSHSILSGHVSPDGFNFTVFHRCLRLPQRFTPARARMSDFHLSPSVQRRPQLPTAETYRCKTSHNNHRQADKRFLYCTPVLPAEFVHFFPRRAVPPPRAGSPPARRGVIPQDNSFARGLVLKTFSPPALSPHWTRNRLWPGYRLHRYNNRRRHRIPRFLPS